MYSHIEQYPPSSVGHRLRRGMFFVYCRPSRNSHNPLVILKVRIFKIIIFIGHLANNVSSMSSKILVTSDFKIFKTCLRCRSRRSKSTRTTHLLVFCGTFIAAYILFLAGVEQTQNKVTSVARIFHVSIVHRHAIFITCAQRYGILWMPMLYMKVGGWTNFEYTPICRGCPP